MIKLYAILFMSGLSMAICASDGQKKITDFFESSSGSAIVMNSAQIERADEAARRYLASFPSAKYSSNVLTGVRLSAILKEVKKPENFTSVFVSTKIRDDYLKELQNELKFSRCPRELHGQLLVAQGAVSRLQ